MRKTRRLLLVVALVLMVLLSVHLTFYWATESSRKATLAQIEKPASVVLHESLVASGAGEETETAAAHDPAVQKAADIISGYDRLFAHIDEMHQQEDIPDYASPSNEWTDEDREKIAAFLHANEDLLREIRAMAERGGPVSHVDFLHGWESATADVTEPLAHMRECARLLKVNAIITAAGGGYSEAGEDVIAGLKLADALAEEPRLISQLVRMAVLSVMNNTVQSALQGGDLPPELLSRLVAQCEESKNRSEFAEALGGDQLIDLTLFSDVRDGEISDLYGPWPYVGATEKLAGQLVCWLYTGPLGRPWYNMDETTYTEISTRTANLAGLPYYEAHPELRQIEEDIENLPFTRFLSRLMLLSGVDARACLLQAHYEAILDLMQMGLLVEQYQVQHGVVPETLEAIAPELGGSVPIDPFTGEPYRYEPRSDTFLLYSVGRNMTDGGGQHDMREGDIVWRGESK